VVGVGGTGCRRLHRAERGELPAPLCILVQRHAGAQTDALPKQSERFWAKVALAGPGECWEWQAAMCKGYGVFWDASRGRMVRAQRFAYEADHRSDP
jgi:hypothetical protein